MGGAKRLEWLGQGCYHQTSEKDRPGEFRRIRLADKVDLLSEIRLFGSSMRVGGPYQKIGAKTTTKTCAHATKRQDRPKI